jgi:hypothetical protein
MCNVASRPASQPAGVEYHHCEAIRLKATTIAFAALSGARRVVIEVIPHFRVSASDVR